MSIRFLHTADWQIGAQFGAISGDAGALLRAERLKAVERIAELATKRQADFALVAGDVFDDNQVTDETLRRTINAMAGFGGPWVLLPGNHDSAEAHSAWTRLRRLGIVPENVIIADVPEDIALCDGRVQILPAPLQRRHESRDLTEWFDRHETPEGVFRIGLAHGSVEGILPEQTEAHNSIHRRRDETALLDYLALGDWHGTFQVTPRTWYAGTPEPDRFKENDSGHVLCVELNEAGAEPRVERVETGRFRWRKLEFMADGAESARLLDREIGRAAGETPERLVLDLRLSGQTDIAERRAIDDCVETWRARLHHLRMNDTGLGVQPSEDDIARMQATGFVRAALDDLLAIQADPAHPDHDVAGEALRILYREHEELT